MNKPAAIKVVQQLHIDRANLRKINPVSSGHTAFVYLTKRGSYVLGAGRLTMGELWLNTPKEIYAVDISPRQEEFELELPSKEEAFLFAASVRAGWQVTDPIAAVRDKLAGPEQGVRRFLEERLREMTRNFTVEDSAAAERQINLEFGNRMARISEAVTVLHCAVVLALDRATRDHIASRTLVLRQREKIDQTRQTEVFSHELAKQRNEHQQELERLTEEHQRELKRERVAIYAEALQSGSHHVLALRLAGHGEDVNDVINLMMQQQKLEFEGAHAVLNSLLDANLVNHRDVAAIMANASDRMAEHLSGHDPLDLKRAKDAKDAVGGGHKPKVIEPAAEDDEDDD